jgi:hypothetical protein
MGIILQFYPNGEFTQGVDTSRPKKKIIEKKAERLHSKDLSISAMKEIIADIDADMLPELEYGTEYQGRNGSTWMVLGKSDKVGHYYYAVSELNGECWETELLHPSYLVRDGFLVPFGLSNALVFKNPPRERLPQKDMTKRMARRIRNGVYLLEKEYGKDCLSFLTLTIPSLSPEGMEKITKNWDKMTNKFLQWLRDKAKASCYKMDYVYCTEIQSNRLKESREYAPHLHIVFRGKIRKRKSWIISCKSAREEWAKIIFACTRECFADSALENLQRIKHSAGRYLSKYLSKGSANIHGDDGDGASIRLSGHWAGMSRKISRDISKGIRRIHGCFRNGIKALDFMEYLPGLLGDGLVSFFYSGFIHIQGDIGSPSARGLHVGGGCLAVPLDTGGLLKCLKWIEVRLSAPCQDSVH